MPNILKVEPGPPMALYPVGTTEEKARAAFVSVYGYKPEHIIVCGGGTLAGPKPEEERERHA